MQYKIQSGMTKRNTARYLNKSALIKMKNKKYTILSEQFQNQNCRKRHNYMTSPFPGRAQTLQYKKGWVKLVLCAQTYPPLSEMIRSCKCFPHVSKMSTLAYNRARRFHLYLYYCIVMNDIQSNLYIKGTQGNL